MKKAAVIPALLALLLSGCGLFPRAAEISELEPVFAMGIDLSEDEVELTMAGGRGGTGGEGGAPAVLTGRSRTLSMAVNAAGMASGRKVFLGNVEYILVGEAFAGDGVRGCIDYLTRDIDIRPATRFVLVRGKAGELIRGEEEAAGFVGRLEALFTEGRELSRSAVYTLADAARQSACGGAMVVPALSNSAGSAAPDGYGVLLDQKLVRWMDEYESIGYALVTGAARQDLLELSDAEGRAAALKMTDSKCRITPLTKGGRLTGAEIELSFELSLTEAHGTIDLFSEETVQDLESKAEQLQLSRVTAVLALCRELETDVLGVGRDIASSRPDLSVQPEEGGDRIFVSLPVTVRAEAHLERTYDLLDTLPSRG